MMWSSAFLGGNNLIPRRATGAMYNVCDGETGVITHLNCSAYVNTPRISGIVFARIAEIFAILLFTNISR